MASASDDSVYELFVINLMGRLDIWNDSEEWSVTWHAVRCLGFTILVGFFLQESVTTGVFYKIKHGTELPLTVN